MIDDFTLDIIDDCFDFDDELSEEVLQMIEYYLETYGDYRIAG